MEGSEGKETQKGVGEDERKRDRRKERGWQKKKKGTEDVRVLGKCGYVSQGVAASMCEFL